MTPYIIQFPRSVRAAPWGANRVALTKSDRHLADRSRSLILESARPAASIGTSASSMAFASAYAGTASDKNPAPISPIRPTADRLAERIGQALCQAIPCCLIDLPRKLAVVLHWITALLPGLNSQNDKGSQATNRKPFVVHLDTSSFSFDYAPPIGDARPSYGINRRRNDFAQEQENARRCDCQ